MVSSATPKERPACRKKAFVFLDGFGVLMGGAFPDPGTRGPVDLLDLD
jgi:hypothetical protein